MATLTDEEIIDKVVAQCRKRQEEGWTIVRGTYLDPAAKECCAVGAFYRTPNDHSLRITQIVADAFGWDPLDVEEFAFGFDDAGKTEAPNAFFALGQVTAAKLDKMPQLAQGA